MSYDTLFDDLAIMDHPDEVRDLEARTYKESYEEFVKAFWDEVPGTEPLQWNWHMSVICRELEVLAQGVFQGLNRDHDTIVNISPGTSKSSLISILYPTWIWANMPNARILSASHTDDLVIDLANKSRYVIKSKRYQELFPHVQIRPDQDSKGYYANTCGGDRYTCTVAGKSPMGFHAHFLICDDPIDPKKAVSEVELKTAKDFFDNVFPSRKVNKQVSVTILVMQRLHEEDPTGHWLKKSKRQGAAKLTHIKLPAELDKNDDGTYSDKNVNPPELAENYVDGLMDPIRLPLSVLNERKTDGIYAYSGQYLQNPVPVGGGMFKATYFLQRTKAAPYHADRVFYIDRASTEDGGCYTAGILMAKDKDKRLFVEWVMHGQWEPYERNQRILAAARRFRSRYGPRNEPTIHIEREGGASGKGDFQDIARLLMGFNVVEHNITGMGKKEFRAGPWSGQLAASNVWLVDNGESEGNGSADWDIENYIQEHVLFPKGKYKDQVDASSGALIVLSEERPAVGMRVLSTRGDRNKELRIYTTDRKELCETIIEEPSLFISLSDHFPLGNAELPPHAIQILVDSLVLQFSDIQPEDKQDNWNEIVHPYELEPEKLIMTRDHAKKLWAFITKKRSTQATAIVIQDDLDRRAISMAMGIAEILGKKPESTVFSLARADIGVGKKVAPNSHVYQMTKTGRSLVV